MVEVEVLVKNVEATRVADEVPDGTNVTYDVKASLSESERNPGQLTLKFNMSIETQPPIAKIDVGGSARLSGEDAEIDALLAVKDTESTPPVFMNIYQKVYAILYLLSGSLKIPYPSPGLLKVAKVTSAAELAPAAGAQKKPDGRISV